ncbi:restriction endonuclease subunit S [Acinetobacter pittii]|uniref:restriction endonuclease subunit S n=1 Tax=Acinetobacter pittii TaxID=48296 RepID=UPI0029FF57B3|nr:restriction endonuclease subunit S [Acinetobacter pittii]MDX8153974.1 restriction endonuclease subunit S [Acinetobacter pittii]
MMIQQNLFNVQDEINTPVGYKKTEVGIIPEDWIIRSIGDFAPLQRGFDLPSRLRKDGLYPVIYSNGFVNTHTEYKVKGPGILTGRSGTIGKVHYVEQNYWPHNTSLWVTKFNEVDPKFIYFLFSKIGFERFLSGSGVPTLNRNDAHSFMIQLPKSIEEQKKIARVLSDTDALISELEKLIEKKQAIKTATMQQLLTGKTRLPEFALREDGTPKAYKDSELGQIPEDWNVTSIGNTLTIKHGKSQKLVETNNGKFPILATGGQIGWAKEYLYNKPSVLIGRKGTINKPRFLDQPFWTVDTLFYSEIDDKYCAKFLFYKFCSIDWNNYNEASGVPSLNAKTIENVHISVCLLDEQKEIVKILNVIDDEITRLKDKRRKLFNIKKSMMQELLTGKTRLV